MRRDPLTGIAVLDDTLEFRDTSESRVLEVLERAADRSSMSDELARHITDWPTRYHFSRSRGRLLEPLHISEGTRVLDIGAGTGAIARSLGERGAQVVALEGDLDRARAAATRCDGLDDVEVICGTLDGYRPAERFDLVCVIGVLEYAQVYSDRPDSATATLERAASLLAPGGAVVLAIENQLGLKYLLGYPEDHLGEPFAGVEGYLGARRIRTWSRRGLGELLRRSGLPHQRWFFPYPDYKLPTVVLADEMFEQPDAVTMVDALVRKPSSEAGHARPTACHEREAHRVFLEAGLGRDVANSFLVVATPEPPGDLVEPTTLAWFLGRERLRSWMRTRTVERVDGGRRIRTSAVDRTTTLRHRGWLQQEDDTEVEFHTGPTVEQLALAACRNHDAGGLRDVLQRWISELDRRAQDREPSSRSRHPFLPADSTRVLPGEMLDVSLSNFVAADDGLHLVDREWRVAGGVDRDLAALRALWYFAADLVGELAPHPFHPDSSVDEVALALAGLAGIEVGPSVLDSLRRAEVKLQAVVTGRPADTIAEELAWIGARNPLDGSLVRVMPFTRLQRELRRLVDGLRHDTAAAAATSSETEAALARAEDAIAKYRQGNLDLERTVRELQTKLSELEHEAIPRREAISHLEKETARLRGVNDSLRAELEAAHLDSRDAQSRLESLSSRRGALEAEVLTLRERLLDARSQLDQQAVEAAEARRIVAEHRSTTAECEGRISALEEERNSLRLEVARLAGNDSRLQALVRDRNELRAEVARLTQFESRVPQLEHECAELQAEIARLAQREVEWHVDANRVVDLRSQVVDLESRLQSAQATIDTLNGELGHWRQWHEAFDRRLPVRVLRALRGSSGSGDPR